MPKELLSPQEHRQYIRLDSVFPVEFRFLSRDGKSFLSGWIQGFTNNIGKGGICLEVNNLDSEFARFLVQDKTARVILEIEMPLGANPIAAEATVAWVRHVPGAPDRHLIGLGYLRIDAAQNKRIIRYARTKRLFVPVVLSALVSLGLALGLNTYLNVKLSKGNQLLVAQLVKIVQESSIAKQKIKEISKQREDLQIEIQALQLRIRSIEEEKLKAEANSAKITELNAQIAGLLQEKAVLEDRLIAVQHKESMVAEDLLRLDKRKILLEKDNFERMYQWLKVHQNQRSGLIMSYEGDSDVSNWAFIYDQALAAICYNYFSDDLRSRKVFDFFKRRAERKDGFFLNAYYCSDGKPAEYTVHSGPNTWLGIAICHYTKKSGDNSYLGLAEEIARNIMALQDEDAEGGIRGGPATSWYSTEHNLDAYSFFSMLYKLTTKAQYQDSARKVLEWLLKHTYDRQDIPIKRGKGDATIATDSYAWSIASLGPKQLMELGMNPDRILEFAEKTCAVEVSFNQPDIGILKLKGFDFAAQRNLPRGGVISAEWTAQMILAFKQMADYYYQKEMIALARSYALKADEYLLQLLKLVISSPSPSGQGQSCLPYATEDFVDTGHGWYTPKGKTTGSVAATAFAIFAYYNYNPLELEE